MEPSNDVCGRYDLTKDSYEKLKSDEEAINNLELCMQTWITKIEELIKVNITFKYNNTCYNLK